MKIWYVGNGDRKNGLKFDMWESAIVKMGSNLKIWCIRNRVRKDGLNLKIRYIRNRDLKTGFKFENLICKKMRS